MIDLEELKRLAEAATPGPWVHDIDGPHTTTQGRAWRILSINAANDQRIADSKYVAAANPAAVLELIAEIERLRSAIDAAKQSATSSADKTEKAS